MQCLNCTNELINLPKKRAKVFCSNTCRTHYWQKAKKLEIEGKSVEDIIKTIRKQKEPPSVSNIETEKQNNTTPNPPDNSSIEAKIKAIQAEKIPPERNTSLGKKIWQLDQNKRIAELKNKMQ